MEKEFQADIDAIQRMDAVPRILEVICRTTGMGFVAIGRVTDERWICCAARDQIEFGLTPGDELELETTICNEIRHLHDGLAVDDIAAHDVYRNHRTPAMYGFQSYISVPIRYADGTVFGTLCAIDPKPTRVDTPETRGMFRLFAELISSQIETLARLELSEASLLDERQSSELREQFIAVLGHDLRSPLVSISAGANMLLTTPLDVEARTIVGLVKSSAERMSGLIDDVLDLARGRLGSGLALERNADAPLLPVLEQVVAELQSTAPGRRIETQFSLPVPVNCDRQRIAQLLSNLLGNALLYGATDRPVRVTAIASDGRFELSVANAGEPIPRAAMKQLFLPFSRCADRPNRQGLGLGLYIASQIAHAHGGELTVTSTVQETRFVFTMPLV